MWVIINPRPLPILINPIPKYSWGLDRLSISRVMWSEAPECNIELPSDSTAGMSTTANAFKAFLQVFAEWPGLWHSWHTSLEDDEGIDKLITRKGWIEKSIVGKERVSEKACGRLKALEGVGKEK